MATARTARPAPDSSVSAALAPQPHLSPATSQESERRLRLLQNVVQKFLLELLAGRKQTEKILRHLAPTFDYSIELFVEAGEFVPRVEAYRIIDVNRPRLADTTDAIRCLRLQSRVPPSAIMKYVISFNQGEAQSGDDRRKHEHVALVRVRPSREVRAVSDSYRGA